MQLRTSRSILEDHGIRSSWFNKSLEVHGIQSLWFYKIVEEFLEVHEIQKAVVLQTLKKHSVMIHLKTSRIVL